MVIAKLELLQDTFESKFDIDKFKTFTREFFNEPEMLSARRHTGIWKEYENNIISYSDIAKFKDAEGKKIIVFGVELKSGKGIERARSLQRNFISKILDQQNCEAAIVAFYSENDVNWRLSFVRQDYTFKDKGLELDLTPAKRYSYLVGEDEKSHTAQKQLYPIFEDDKHNPTLDEIEAAFSVEKVTKDFFEQYKNKYYDLKEYLEKDEAFINETLKLGFEVNKFSEQFAKKLMGQLAFLYFLQKKGWLGVRIMPEDHNIEKPKFMEIYNSQNNIHKEILKKLFFQGKDGTMKLSTRLFHSITDSEADLLSDCFVGTELDMPWGSGNKKFIRGIFEFCINNTNKNFFDDYLESFFYDALNKRRKNQYYKQFNCKIPFLNGGLFEPLEGYHWKEADFEIPNNIFSNVKEKGREADGVLDIFDRYNFTMNEDEPLEKEVAVDLEMLGKIFENLLDGKDRKAKGAFYTPREIVNHMCQESLTNYLVNEVNVPYEDMKEFILYGELIRDADNRTNVGYGKNFTIKQSIFDKIVQIDEALKNIRVADPAVGSGAFPLGMLNEIVKARLNISEYLIKFLKSDEEKRIFKKNRHPYKIKWATIKNSIFAVDIESSAIDIAKLRLWLSLVVDQEIDEDNPYPHALPNLDCNIMCGNSLIEEFEGIKLFDESLLEKRGIATHEEPAAYQLSLFQDQIETMLDDLFIEQDRLFEEEDGNKKAEIKKRIDEKTSMIIKAKLSRDSNLAGLRRYDESMKQKTKPYFVWKLEFARVFKEKGGFDIVIGNPPYVQIKQISWEDRKVFERIYNSAVGRFNLFYFFLEKTNYITKDNGITSFIVPDRLLLNTQCSELRKWLLNKQNILNIISFDESVFADAVVDSIIISYCNHECNKLKIHIKDRILLKELNEKNYLKIPVEHLKNSANNQFILNYNVTETELLNKIKAKSITLGEISEVKDGIIQGKVEDLLFLKEQIDEHSKPLLFGKDIIKYKILFKNNWVNYKPGEIMKVEVQRRGDGVRPGLWMRNPEIFERKKILTRQTADEIIAAYDTEFLYYANTLHGTTITNEEYMTEYVLGILNSRLITWYYRTTTAEEGKVFAQIKIALLRQLPILIADNSFQRKVKYIVEEIHELRQRDEQQKIIYEKIKIIDDLLYEAYGLTENEINIINSKEG